jgi:hypothetical protein
MIFLLRNLSLLEYYFGVFGIKRRDNDAEREKKTFELQTQKSAKRKNRNKKVRSCADFQCSFHNKASSSVFFLLIFLTHIL